MWTIIPLRGVRTWIILAQVITGDFAASRSVPYMAYIARVVTGVWCGDLVILIQNRNCVANCTQS